MAAKIIADGNGGRRIITSYDCGCEHSVERLLETQRLVEEAGSEPPKKMPSRAERRQARSDSPQPQHERRARA